MLTSLLAGILSVVATLLLAVASQLSVVKARLHTIHVSCVVCLCYVHVYIIKLYNCVHNNVCA